MTSKTWYWDGRSHRTCVVEKYNQAKKLSNDCKHVKWWIKPNTTNSIGFYSPLSLVLRSKVFFINDLSSVRDSQISLYNVLTQNYCPTIERQLSKVVDVTKKVSCFEVSFLSMSACKNGSNFKVLLSYWLRWIFYELIWQENIFLSKELL